MQLDQQGLSAAWDEITEHSHGQHHTDLAWKSVGFGSWCHAVVRAEHQIISRNAVSERLLLMSMTARRRARHPLSGKEFHTILQHLSRRNTSHSLWPHTRSAVMH